MWRNHWNFTLTCIFHHDFKAPLQIWFFLSCELCDLWPLRLLMLLMPPCSVLNSSPLVIFTPLGLLWAFAIKPIFAEDEVQSWLSETRGRHFKCYSACFPRRPSSFHWRQSLSILKWVKYTEAAHRCGGWSSKHDSLQKGHRLDLRDCEERNWSSCLLTGGRALDSCLK